MYTSMRLVCILYFSYTQSFCIDLQISMNIHYIGFQFLLCGIVCSQHATIANSQTWCMCTLCMCVCAFKNCACACTMEIIYISNIWSLENIKQQTTQHIDQTKTTITLNPK
jgi:hypothetical protein